MDRETNEERWAADAGEVDEALADIGVEGVADDERDALILAVRCGCGGVCAGCVHALELWRSIHEAARR